MMKIVQSLDLFPKFGDDIRQKTSSGGILAVLSFLIMGIFFSMRFDAYFYSPISHEFVINSFSLPFSSGRVVDPSKLPKMDINFDIHLRNLPCAYIHVDVIDTIKESDLNAEGRVRMERYDKDGELINMKHFPKTEKPPPANYCGPCYSMKSGCCNTCKEVRQAFKSKARPLPPIATIEQCTREGYDQELRAMINESCRVHGTLTVHRFPGTFHIAPGDSIEGGGEHDVAYERLGLNITDFNLTHEIKHFSIGIPLKNGFFPIDNTLEVQKHKGRMKMFYYIRAVPYGESGNSFSIGVSKYQNYRGNHSKKYPGVFFSYDISPIGIVQGEKPSLLLFLSDIMSILGGVFAIATFVDSVVFHCLPEFSKLE